MSDSEEEYQETKSAPKASKRKGKQSQEEKLADIQASLADPNANFSIKTGGNFKKRPGRADDSPGARRGGKRAGGGGEDISVKVVYGDTQSTLPSYLKGHVKTDEEQKLQTVSVNTNKAQLQHQVTRGGRALPKGSAADVLATETKKPTTDKKGKRYDTGNTSAAERARAAQQRKQEMRAEARKQNANPIVKWIGSLCASIQRQMLLRQQNKTPVILNERAKAITDALDMSQEDLKKLRFAFGQIDFSGEGTIMYDEFFDAMQLKRCLFTDALYDQLIARSTGHLLSLDDFVIVVTLYAMYGKIDILRMVFNMFDKDGSGTIDEEEFMHLCSLVNDGAPVFPGNFKNALQQFDTNDDGLIDFEEFQHLNFKYPIVLYPAFRLQDAMQKATLGEKGWLRIQEHVTAKRRLEQYMAKHGGLPPPSFKTQLAHSPKFQYKCFRALCPCFVPKIPGMSRSGAGGAAPAAH